MQKHCAGAPNETACTKGKGDWHQNFLAPPPLPLPGLASSTYRADEQSERALDGGTCTLVTASFTLDSVNGLMSTSANPSFSNLWTVHTKQEVISNVTHMGIPIRADACLTLTTVAWTWFDRL